MPSFTDAAGREWTIKFDGLLLAELRDQYKINLGDLTGGDYLRLEHDLADLTVAVCCLVGTQLKTHDPPLSRQQLAAALVGQALDDALAAIWEAAKIFFPPKRLSELLSASNQLRETNLALRIFTAMPAAAQQALAPLLADAMAVAGTTNSTSSPANGSAPGQVATPSPSALNAPATAESGPTG